MSVVDATRSGVPLLPSPQRTETLCRLSSDFLPESSIQVGEQVATKIDFKNPFQRMYNEKYLVPPQHFLVKSACVLHVSWREGSSEARATMPEHARDALLLPLSRGPRRFLIDPVRPRLGRETVIVYLECFGHVAEMPRLWGVSLPRSLRVC